MIIVLVPRQLYTVDILYFRPQTHILQQFIWQVEDIPPSLPRIHKFFNFWHNEIEAIISEINIIDCNSGFQICSDEFKI